jgi:calcium-dependent protein kinase
MAPELLKGDYDSKVDIWSIGVIAFSLLSSSLPFYGEDRIAVMKKILRGKYRFASRRWANISLDAKNFINTLLNTNPVDRPTGFQAMESIWINGTEGTEGGIIPFTIEEIDQMDKIQASIQNFASYPTLKKLALMMVAYKSTSEEVGFLRRMFSKYDITKDGEIILPEFKQALADHYDYSDEEIENLFHGIDIDGTGKVHYIEFVAATIEAHGAIDEERLAEAFDRIDSDDSGYITVSDLRAFLGQDIPQSYIEKIISEADIVNDHRVSYEEFLELWDKDADEKLKSIKMNIRKRRKLYPNIVKLNADNHSAATSSVSSDDDFTLSDTEQTDEIAETGEPKADFYFSQRKFQSIRKVEIDMQEMDIGFDKL